MITKAYCTLKMSAVLGRPFFADGGINELFNTLAGAAQKPSTRAEMLHKMSNDVGFRRNRGVGADHCSAVHEILLGDELGSEIGGGHGEELDTAAAAVGQGRERMRRNGEVGGGEDGVRAKQRREKSVALRVRFSDDIYIRDCPRISWTGDGSVWRVLR